MYIWFCLCFLEGDYKVTVYYKRVKRTKTLSVGAGPSVSKNQTKHTPEPLHKEDFPAQSSDNTLVPLYLKILNKPSNHF